MISVSAVNKEVIVIEFNSHVGKFSHSISGKFSRILFQAKCVEQHCEGDAQRGDQDRGVGTHHSGNCLGGWMDGWIY